MAQISIVSADGPNFTDACQSSPADEREYIGSVNEAPCELAAAAEMAGELFNSDPLAFMPNISEKLESLAYDFMQNSLSMCMSRESTRVSYRWETGDANTVAKKLLSADGDEAKAFAQHVSRSDDLSFSSLTLSALAATTKGSILASSILKQLRNPALGVAILFDMKNPARAARILNLWEHQSNLQRDEITFELNKISFAKIDGGIERRYNRVNMYQYGANIDANLFYNPLTAVRISETVLIGFDKYEEATQFSGQSSWQMVESLMNARTALEAHLQALISRKLIKPCHISYGPRGRIEDMACALIPPPPPVKQSDLTVEEKNDSQDNLDRLDSLINNYEYCESMIDSIADAIVSTRYQMMDASKAHDIRDLMITLEDTIDDIEEDEKKLFDKGYDLPGAGGSEELRAFLDDVEDEFIDIECVIIDREIKNLELKTDIPQ